MGKFKSKSTAVEQRRRRKKKAPTVVQSNPFEVRVNKEKYSILGRKMKHDKGLPGLSRSKSIKKVQDYIYLSSKTLMKSNPDLSVKASIMVKWLDLLTRR